MKEIILPCKCHKITATGKVYSRLYQFSQKGIQGIQTKIGRSWRELKPILTNTGYLQCNIHGRIIRINRLIALNFILNPFAYPEVQHINGIKTDNRIANLKWGNQKHNAEDREKHGHSIHGSKSPNAKLTEKEVMKIRKERRNTSLRLLAKKYGVSKKLILLIVQRKIWRHI